MLIILEGPDGAGKTTMITKLAEQYPSAIVYHFGEPVKGEDQFKRYLKPIKDNPGRLIIYDRSWYSEFVYGPVMRNTHELLHVQSKLLEEAVQAHGGGHVIYLTACILKLWERCTERGETYIQDIETLNKIRLKYEEVMATLPSLPVIRSDTSR